MAIDLFSETSPRISFSHDLLGQTDFVPINNNNSRSDTSLLDSTSSEDFEFGVSNSHEHESSSADELFSDGVILPIQILKKTATPKQANPIFSLPPRPEPPSSSSSCWNSENSKEKPQAKSFWSFKRSSSLNCENGHKRSLLCSLPLLSRSNSTGSVPNPKRSTMSSSSSSKDTLKQNPYKLLPSISMSKSASSSSSTTTFYTYPLQQKQTKKKKKNYGGSSSSSSSSSSYGGVRISPVLNVPPPYISKSTANLFGLASFFGNGKDHNNKKNKK